MHDVVLAHPDIERLRAFGLGQLLPEESTSVEEHVARCDACCQLLRGLGDDTLVTFLRAADTAPDTLPAPQDALPPELANHPRYRVVALLGSGGMGTVYQAEHRLMERPVALKVIRRELTARPAVVERFRREVKAAARLAHPNIVTAHDADQAGDTHFLVMEFVEGTTLAKVIEERGPLPVAEACDYVRQAALGLQHACEHGMVHRDVKPHNLMLSPAGQVKILDFGLARLAEPLSADAADSHAAADDGATLAGMVLGTADYIAPEQVGDPHTADIRADIYSLGCTLYFLLTGQPPFPEGTVMHKLVAHRETTPPPLSGRRDDLPPGLVRILDRMLVKDPARRYQTPLEVALALEPFARTTPQRRPTRSRAWVAALLAFLLLGGACGVITYRIATDQGELVISTDDPEVEIVIRQGGQQIEIVDPKTKQTVKLRAGEYEVALTGKEDELRLSTNHFTLKRGDREIVRVERQQKVSPADQAMLQRLDAIRLERDAVVLFTDGSLSLTTRKQEARRFEGHTGWVMRVAFSPDGKRVLSSSADGTARLWDVESGKEVIRLQGHKDRVDSAAFSPDGRYVLTGAWDGTIRLWDAMSGKQLRVSKSPAGEHICAVHFLPDGKRFISCPLDHRAPHLWDLVSGQMLKEVAPHEGHVYAIAIAPDGRTLVLGNWEVAEPLHLWDIESGKELRQFAGHTGQVGGLAFSPDGRLILSGSSDKTVRLWDVASGRELRRFAGHTDRVHPVAFSPDGGRILSAGSDRTVRLWDMASGKELACFTGHTGNVRSVAFSPDGRRALSGGEDKTMRLWQLP